MHGEYRVYMVHCVYTVYQTSVYIQCIYDTVYDRSSRVRGAGYRSYCVSDQNPPPPQCQPAPVIAHTQERDVTVFRSRGNTQIRKYINTQTQIRCQTAPVLMKEV